MKKGFIYVDIIIALLIIGLVIASVFQVNLKSIQRQQENSRQMRAFRLAQNIMEEQLSQPVWKIHSIGDATNHVRCDDINPSENYSYSVVAEPCVSDPFSGAPIAKDVALKKITVAVYYQKKTGGAEDYVDIVSYKGPRSFSK